MADDGQEKTHDPSEKKKRDAAEKGQIPKTQEFSSALVLLSGAAALTYLSGPLTGSVRHLTLWCFDVSGPQNLGEVEAMALIKESMISVLQAAGPMLGCVFFAALVAGFSQTRFQLATKALEPKWDKLEPFGAFKSRYLSWTPVMELAKGLTKLGALAVLTWYAVKDRLDELPGLAMTEPGALLAVMVDFGWTLTLWATPLILVIAIADYAYQWWKTNEDLKMTDQEYRQENKEQNGDPYMRQARKQRARQLAMGNTLREVPKADVVVTNPTHYAVALRYRPDEAGAPVIVAMGVDHLALKIRQVARQHDIPCIENRPLARALHAQGKAGYVIPPELYGAVAKVLAVVFKRRARRAQAR